MRLLLLFFLLSLSFISFAQLNTSDIEEFYPCPSGNESTCFSEREPFLTTFREYDGLTQSQALRLERVNNYMEYTRQCFFHYSERNEDSENLYGFHNRGGYRSDPQKYEACLRLSRFSPNTFSEDNSVCANSGHRDCYEFISYGEYQYDLFERVLERVIGIYGWNRGRENYYHITGSGDRVRLNEYIDAGRFILMGDALDSLFKAGPSRLELVDQVCLSKDNILPEWRFYECLKSNERRLRRFDSNESRIADSVIPFPIDQVQFREVSFSDTVSKVIESEFHGRFSLRATNQILEDFLEKSLSCQDVAVYRSFQRNNFRRHDYIINGSANCPSQITNIEIELDIEHESFFILDINITDSERGELSEKLYVFRGSLNYYQNSIENNYNYVQD